MPQLVAKLSPLKVQRAKPGMHNDGGGLYLQVSPSGARSWIFRFKMHGRSREMGLGSAHTISLAEARLRAAECRRRRLDGIDPIEHREAERHRRRMEAAKALTFRTAAEKYIETHRAGWRNDKHAAQWSSTLATYVYPVFGSMPVQSVDEGLVLRAIEPIWSEKPETASRVRQRIESILDWATARRYREGANPARWKGHLDQTLPKLSKVRQIRHHAALPYRELPAFMRKLRTQTGIAARALEFTILTAARTGEVIEARWNELADANVWIVPPERMKAGKEHRVPLSAPAAEIVEAQRENPGGSFVFQSGRADRPLSNMAMAAVLKRMGCTEVTVHGFRSSFRDWASEQTTHPDEVVEMALAHAVGNKVQQAYRRTALFEKRTALMRDWGMFCTATQRYGEVIPLRSSEASAA